MCATQVWSQIPRRNWQTHSFPAYAAAGMVLSSLRCVTIASTARAPRESGRRLGALGAQLSADRPALQLRPAERERPVRDLQRHLAARPHQAAHREALHELVLVE